MYSQTILSSIGDVVLTGIIIGGANFLFTIPGIYVINTFGRKTLMIGGGIFMTAGMFGLGVGMLQNINFLSIISILVFVLAFEFSWGPIVWLYNAEILTDKAVSLATVFNWVTNMVITIICPTI